MCPNQTATSLCTQWTLPGASSGVHGRTVHDRGVLCDGGRVDPAGDHPGRDGRRHLRLAPGAGGVPARSARRRERHRARPGARAPAAGRRPRRPHAPRARRVSVPGPWPSACGTAYYIAGGKARDAVVPARAMQTLDNPRDRRRVVCRRQLRRGVPRARGPLPIPVGINYLEKIQIAAPAVDLRRDARRRGLRADGRRHPARRFPACSTAWRATSRPPTRSTSPARRTATTRRPFDPRDFVDRHWRRPRAPDVSRHHRVGRPGAHAAAQGQRPRRRLHRRGADRRRAQRAAAGQTAAERARRAGLRRARRGEPGEAATRSVCRSGWPAATARPSVSARRSQAGAAGVQVGTAFAFCEESGLRADYRRALMRAAVDAGAAEVFTDPLASPTGFPFKVAQLAGTMSDPAVYASAASHLRPRLPARGLPPGRWLGRVPVSGRTG